MILSNLFENFLTVFLDKGIKLAYNCKSTEGWRKASDVLEDLVKQWEACQRISPGPIWFNVSIPNETYLLFGAHLLLNLMFLDCKAVFHITGTTTHFSASTS